MSRPQILIDMSAKETGEKFMGVPVRWLDAKPVLFRCESEKGHVSRWYIKSEQLRDNVCPECKKPVWITFPEDKDD